MRINEKRKQNNMHFMPKPFDMVQSLNEKLQFHWKEKNVLLAFNETFFAYFNSILLPFSSHLFFTPQLIVIFILIYFHFFGCYIKISWNVFYGVVQQGDLNFTSSKKK